MQGGEARERPPATAAGPPDPPASPLRLLLVHDDAPTCEGLTTLVEARLGPQRSLRVDTLPALDAALRRRDWDVVLLAPPLRRIGGREALALLFANGEPCPVLVLLGADADIDASDALRAGAREVLDRGDPEAVVTAVDRLVHPERDGGDTARDATLRLVRRLATACDLRDGLAAALERVLDVVCRELDLPYGESWLRASNGSALTPGAIVTQDPALATLRVDAHERLPDDVLHEALAAKAARSIDDLAQDAGVRFARAPQALSLGLGTATVVPVVHLGRVEALLVTLGCGGGGGGADGRVRDVLEFAAAQLSHQLSTSRGEAEASLERHRTALALELLRDGVMACDGDGHVTVFNRAMERFHGKGAAVGVEPERWPEAYDLYLQDGITAMRPGEMPLYRALHGEYVVDERFVIAAPGVRRRSVRASAVPLEAGTAAGALMVVHDESDRIVADAEAKAAGQRALQTFSLMLDHLAELAARIGEAPSLEAAWPAFGDFAEHALAADELYIVRVEPSTSTEPELEVLYASSRATASAATHPTHAPPAGNVAKEAIRSRRLALERDQALPALDPQASMRSALAAPLTLGADVIGAIEVRSRRPHAFDDGNAVTLTMAANLAALAMDHADLVDVERRSRALAETAARRFEQAFNANPAAVALLSLERGTLLDANPAMETLSGLRRDGLVDRDPVALGLWDADAAQQLATSGGLRGLEMHVRRADGSLRTCLLSTEETGLEGSDGSERALLILALDVTERLEQQRQLRDLARFRESLMTFIGETLDDGFEGPFYQRLLHAAVRATPNAEAGALLLRDAHDDRFHYVAVFGYVLEALQDVRFDATTVARLVGDGGATVVRDFERSDLSDSQRAALRSAGRSDELATTLVVPIVVDGEQVAVVTLDSFSDPDAFDVEALRLGEAFAAQVATLIKRRALEHELEHRAYHDALTGLPNRLLFLDRLQQAVTRAQRTGERGAALFVDVDNLKVTNDALGHAVGDDLLCAIGERLRSVVRAEDTVARIGGDEFTVVLQQVSDGASAGTVAEKLLGALREPFMLHGHELHVSASIGVTLFPDDATDADTLVRHGDTAMYQAKAEGKDRFRFFTPEMNRALLERASLEAQLRLGLQRDEFSLAFQPRVALDDGRITSVEALARWHHPERGAISPGAFIPVAEDTGLIGQLGATLLQRACEQAKAWSDAGTPTVVAFNLSARQLQERDVVALVQRVLDRVGLDPSLLELELTESAVMHNVAENVVTLTRLRALGVHVSIDDFGTAYSSLNYLKQLPATALKIDQSFVRDIGGDAASPHDSAIVRAIIALANALDLVAIAEGIESEAQLRFLRESGCSQGQGYLFSHPIGADQIGALLRRGRVDMP